MSGLLKLLSYYKNNNVYLGFTKSNWTVKGEFQKCLNYLLSCIPQGQNLNS